MEQTFYFAEFIVAHYDELSSSSRLGTARTVGAGVGRIRRRERGNQKKKIGKILRESVETTSTGGRSGWCSNQASLGREKCVRDLLAIIRISCTPSHLLNFSWQVTVGENPCDYQTTV